MMKSLKYCQQWTTVNRQLIHTHCFGYLRSLWSLYYYTTWIRHELSTNLARTLHFFILLSNVDNAAAFIGSRKEGHWLTQRPTNREERKIGEWGNHCETDWLRTIDATRKEENHWWKKADDIREHLSGGQRRQEKQTNKMGHETKIK